jgi:transcription antitermination factor NusG
MKKVSIPLFPGYIFVNLLEEDRLNILNTQGVIRILGTNGEPEPIPDEQIDFIKTLQETNMNYDPWPYFTEGKEVIVLGGRLRKCLRNLLNTVANTG